MKKIVNIMILMIIVALSACSNGNSGKKSLTMDIAGETYTVNTPKLPFTIQTRFGSYKVNDISIAKADTRNSVYIYLDSEIIESKETVFNKMLTLYVSDNDGDSIESDHVRIITSLNSNYGENYIMNAGKGDTFTDVFQVGFFLWENNENKKINIIHIKDVMENVSE